MQNASVGRWLLGGVLAHDAAIAPAVFVLGALVARWSGARVRQALAAIALIGGSVLIVGWPEVLRKGRNANPTVGTLDYNRNILIALLAVVGGVVLVTAAPTVAARNRRRRAEKARAAAAEQEAAAAREAAARAAEADKITAEATASTHTPTAADPTPQSTAAAEHPDVQPDQSEDSEETES